MNCLLSLITALVCALAAACASQHDNFYTLSILPEIAATARIAPAIHVLLSVDIPSLVDRAEMVVGTSASDVQVLDHERWVSSLSDQVRQTLARDLEKRRVDVLVGDRGFEQKGMTSVVMRVDIVRMWATSGRAVGIEAHWRLQDEAASTDEVGGGVFEAPLQQGAAYSSVARAYSQTLSELAEKLAAGIRSTSRPVPG